MRNEGGCGEGKTHDDVVHLAEEVLVHSYLPTGVVVRVRHEVDVDLAILGACLLVNDVVYRRGTIFVRRRVRVRGFPPGPGVLVFPPRGRCRNEGGTREKLQHGRSVGRIAGQMGRIARAGRRISEGQLGRMPAQD